MKDAGIATTGVSPGSGAVHAVLVDGYKVGGPPPGRQTTDSLAALGRLLLAGTPPASVTLLAAGTEAATAPIAENILREISRVGSSLLILAVSGEWFVEQDQLCLRTGQRGQPGLPLSALRGRVESATTGALVLVQASGTVCPDPDQLCLNTPFGAALVLQAEGSDLFDGLATTGLAQAGDLEDLAAAMALELPGLRSTVWGPTTPVLRIPDSQLVAAVLDTEDRRSTSPMPSRAPVMRTLPGDLRLIHPLAEGSLGQVYIGEQPTLGRRVAVKVLKQPVEEGTRRWRLFRNEVHSLGRISHPNVVRIHTADFTEDGRPFYAMELVRGGTLRERLRDGGLPERDAIEIMLQILAGLQAAHDVGVFHGDLKPENILVEQGNGRVVLVDFGLARWANAEDEPVPFTHAYVAPEQRKTGRPTTVADLYAAGLILVELLTGWRRSTAQPTPPPDWLLNSVEPRVAAAVGKATHSDPAQRFQDARTFREALGHRSVVTALATGDAPAFRWLSAYTQNDASRFFGRDSEAARLVDQILFNRLVVVTAASGVGKSSLVAAGVIPRLHGLAERIVYLACPAEPEAALTEALAAGARSLSEAARIACEGTSRVVVVLDQVEALFLDPEVDREARDALIRRLAALVHHGPEPLRLVLLVREDHLAHVLDGRLGTAASIRRIPPLRRDAAISIIKRTLDHDRLDITPDALDTLVDDLVVHAAHLSAQLGWAVSDAVYPPHLQMVCSILVEGLPPGDDRVTLDHYHQLGGASGVLSGYLDRVLDTELSETDADVARLLFKELVSSAGTRVSRAQTELASRTGVSPERALAVLEILARNRLATPLRAEGDVLVWELTHDSLVDRIMSWMDRSELRERRVREMLRFHLHRSTAAVPHLLDLGELREAAGAPDAVATLDRELAADPSALLAAQLLRASWARIKKRRAAIGLSLGALAVALLVAGGLYLQQRVAMLADLGRYTVRVTLLTPAGSDADAAAYPDLAIRLHHVGGDNELGPGRTLEDRYTVTRNEDGTFDVEAPGGRYTVAVAGRHLPGAPQCGPSLLRDVVLPGYASRATSQNLNLRVPDCNLTLRDTAIVPGGESWAGDKDDPHHGEFLLRKVSLSTFTVDRFEVSNEQYSAYLAAVNPLKDEQEPPIVPEKKRSNVTHGLAEHPVVGLSWHDALRYCAWMGKSLPTLAQLEKAGRGGLCLDGSAPSAQGCTKPNPLPQRRFPWGDADPVSRAAQSLAWQTRDEGVIPKTWPVRSMPESASPYGLHHAVGNATEWCLDGPELERYTTQYANPTGSLTSAERYAHGAWWWTKEPYQLWVGGAVVYQGGDRRGHTGIRCAIPPAQLTGF